MLKDEALAFLKMLWTEQRGAFVGVVSGVLLGILILLFGFWRILFVFACAGVGLWLGHMIDTQSGMWLEEKLHWKQGDFHRLK